MNKTVETVVCTALEGVNLLDSQKTKNTEKWITEWNTHTHPHVQDNESTWGNMHPSDMQALPLRWCYNIT